MYIEFHEVNQNNQQICKFIVSTVSSPNSQDKFPILYQLVRPLVNFVVVCLFGEFWGISQIYFTY